MTEPKCCKCGEPAEWLEDSDEPLCQEHWEAHCDEAWWQTVPAAYEASKQLYVRDVLEKAIARGAR